MKTPTTRPTSGGSWVRDPKTGTLRPASREGADTKADAKTITDKKKEAGA